MAFISRPAPCITITFTLSEEASFVGFSYFDNGVRRLLEEPVQRPPSVGHFLQEEIELLSVGSFAVRSAQGERQEVQHCGDDQGASASRLEIKWKC